MDAINLAIIARTEIDLMGDGDCDDPECADLKVFVFKVRAATTSLSMFLEEGEEDPELFDAIMAYEPRFDC